jgi:hypothetical protein
VMFLVKYDGPSSLWSLTMAHLSLFLFSHRAALGRLYSLRHKRVKSGKMAEEQFGVLLLVTVKAQRLWPVLDQKMLYMMPSV